MTRMGTKCVEGAAQSSLSLSKCVNKVAQWGAQLVTGGLTLLIFTGTVHCSGALLQLMGQGGAE